MNIMRMIIVKSRKKSDNKLIVKRRKKKKRRSRIVLCLFIISLLVILSFNLTYFNILDIEVKGNKNVTDSYVLETSHIKIGENILYENYYRAKKELLKNPYIENVKISFQLPGKVVITLKERGAYYYFEKDNTCYVIDNNGILLEKRKDIDKTKLVNITGFALQKQALGKPLQDKDSRKINLIKEIASLMQNCTSKLRMNKLDITNIANIECNFGNMKVKLGGPYDIKAKLNKSINIIELNKLQDKKGYVDVSFKGSPVFFIEQ